MPALHIQPPRGHCVKGPASSPTIGPEAGGRAVTKDPLKSCPSKLRTFGGGCVQMVRGGWLGVECGQWPERSQEAGRGSFTVDICEHRLLIYTERVSLFVAGVHQDRMTAFINLSFLKIWAFWNSPVLNPSFFQKELSYFSRPRYITYLQILHEAQCNSYLSNTTKNEALCLRLWTLQEVPKE
jgi:hypothetical protein